MPGVWRPLIRLAGPVVVEQLLTLMVGLVDTWLTGNFVPGEAPMAAVGLMAYLLWLIPSLFASIAIGATALVARFIGAGNVDDARRTTNQAFLCGALLATVITVAFWFGADALVAALGLVGEAQTLATRYLRWIVPIIPAVMIIQVGMACLRGAGDTYSGFVAMACVNVVNAIVSAALVTGFGPFPHLGWEGMAIGTALGHALGAMIILLLLLGGRYGLKLNLNELRPNRDLIGRLFRVGAPGGLDVLSVLTCHLCFVRMVNGLGTLASSAHMLAVRIEAIAYLPGTAFQVAAGTMAGQYLGAEDHDRAIRGVRAACWAGLALMGMAGLLFYFGGPWLTAFFTGDAKSATALTAVPVLRVAAFAMPGMALDDGPEWRVAWSRRYALAVGDHVDRISLRPYSWRLVGHVCRAISVWVGNPLGTDGCLGVHRR